MASEAHSRTSAGLTTSDPVVAHDGEIDFQSMVGLGTTFCVEPSMNAQEEMV
jgi:hypothetical protein